MPHMAPKMAANRGRHSVAAVCNSPARMATGASALAIRRLGSHPGQQATGGSPARTHQTAVRPPSGPRTAAELLPVMVARVPHRLGLGRSRSSFQECDQLAKWASATTPAALYLTPASMASEARSRTRDYQSTQVHLDETIRGLDRLPWCRPARVRLYGVESTTRPGRRERSAQRSALAAPYQVRARGHISMRES